MAEVLKLTEPLRPRTGKGSVADQADAWAAVLYSGMATEDDRQQFSRWLRESPAHAAAYARTEQLWRDLGMAAHLDAKRSAAPTSATPQRTAARRRWPLRMAAAAMLIVAVGIAGWQAYEYSQTRFTTGIGEIRTASLADGSRITLSGDTRIIAHVDGPERHVELVRGRAFFDVAPDTTRPFLVRAAATEIRVVGTAFDVNRSPGGVQVAVTEGVVEILEPHTVIRIASDDAPASRPAAATLTAGQKIVAGTDGSLTDEPQAFDATAELGWQSGRLHYVNTRLDTVITEVNRYRKHKIVLDEARLGAYSVTTSFRTDQTDQLLSGLAASYPVLISQQGNTVVVRAR